MIYQPDVMLYHANCADGFGAAWAAWIKWGDAVDYRPVSYGQEPPTDLSGKHVLIGDFSYKRDALAVLAETTASLVILDHHKSAVDELQPWRAMVDTHASLLSIVTSVVVEFATIFRLAVAGPVNSVNRTRMASPTATATVLEVWTLLPEGPMLKVCDAIVFS